MKHFLFINDLTGKKFKTTLTGKAALEKNPSLKKNCTLLGECDSKGQPLEGQQQAGKKVVNSIKEIMNANKQKQQNGKDGKTKQKNS